VPDGSTSVHTTAVPTRTIPKAYDGHERSGRCGKLVYRWLASYRCLASTALLLNSWGARYGAIVFE
jgi:hypothetical protein